VDPWAAHVEAIAANGLRVTGVADFVAPVRAVRDARELPPCEFAIVATKAAHTRAAVEAAKTAIADATVVSVQNGIGNEEVVAEIVPLVARGSIVPAGTVVEPGTVRFEAGGESWFGPFEPSPAPAESIEELAGLLTAGGLTTHALPDARGPQWTKVVFNAATSPLAALTGLTVGQVCTEAGLRREVDALVSEALEVCAAAGISLTRDPQESIAEAIEVAYGHKPSMLQDILAGRASEVDVLNGGIAGEGRRVGVPTPHHDLMCALVHGLESTRVSASA
jgi:2-dehydropantoate 2-reductase